MANVKLNFENCSEYQPAFFIGQCISGLIKLSLTHPKTFTNLEIQIVGESLLDWKAFSILPWRHHKYHYHIARQHISEKEIFLCKNYSIFKVKTELLPGENEFKFSFDLPTDISPSFKGKFGEICYSIEAIFTSDASAETLTSEKLFFDCFYGQNPTQKFVFTTLPSLEASKVYNKCFYKSLPLKVTVGMPTVSFLSGEEIIVQIHIDNESGIKVRRVVINLVEVTKYKSLKSESSKREDSEVILSEDFFKRAIQENDNLEAVIKLPYLNPIFLSKIISVSYEFHVILKTSNLQSFPKIVIPLNVDVLD